MLCFPINITINILYNIMQSPLGIGDWGLGIGDWGLGIGDWAQSPIPNPQSPIPNPQSPIPKGDCIMLYNIFIVILIGKHNIT